MLAATPRALGLDVPRLAAYYEQVADWILPHLVDRPLALLRSLGEQELPFFQKHAKVGSPGALSRIPIVEGAAIAEHLAVRDRAGLSALPAIETLEIHIWGSRVDRLEQPDRLVFDLDPGPDVAWRELVEAALLVKDALVAKRMNSFAMLTGSRGIHLFCPLEPRADWNHARAFARDIVDRLVTHFPSRFVGNHSMAERAGRIFIDHLRNDWGATSIAPYSTRARRGGFVAAPVSWDELSSTTGSAMFDVVTMPQRLASITRDPWGDLEKVDQAL